MAQHKLIITMHDGEEIEVLPNLWDTIAFEKYLRNNPHLGTVQQNTMTLHAFRGWHAATQRLGLFSQTWEEFSQSDKAAQMVTIHEEKETDEREVAGLGLDTSPAA